MEGHYIVQINNKCNSNCCFCADSFDVRRNPDPVFDDLIKNLEYHRNKFDSLIISGGEPTIYKQIFEYIEHAKKNCQYNRIIIVTNGFLLYYQNFTDKLIQKGVDTFQISFLSSDPKTYDAITKVRNSFTYVKQAISNIKKRGKNIMTNTVLHKFNYFQAEDIISFLIDQKVDIIQLVFMNPIGSNIVDGKSIVALSYTELLPYIKTAFKKAKELDYNNLFIENLPICIIPDLRANISDLRKPRENKVYYNTSKIKPEKCKSCIHLDICDGVWKAYLDQFGDSELNPITA